MLLTTEMARRCFGVFLLFLLTFVLGSCEESSEKSTEQDDDYMQIFHSKPILSEYMRAMLEDRPEILEKNDIIFFQDKPGGACKRKMKKHLNEMEYNYEDGDNRIDEEERNDDVNKRSADKDDLSNANDDFTTEPIDQKNLGFKEHVNEIRARKVQNKVNNQRLNDGTKLIDRKEFKATKVGITKATKRNVGNSDNIFIGSMDLSELSLSPEDVEEQAIKIEQAIEDHNEKKNVKH